MLKLVHQLPGRIRFELPEMYGNPSLAFHLKHNLETEAGIRHVQTSSLSARVLIFYSTELMNLPTLTQLIKQSVAGLHAQSPVISKSKSATSALPTQVFELESLPIVRQLLWTTAAGVLFLYANAKHNSSIKPSGKKVILNIDTLLTIISGYPILKTASDHLLCKGRLNTEFLASVASFASLAIEENRLGAFINLIVYLSTLLRTVAAEYTRDKIRTILTGRQTWARLITSHCNHVIPTSEIRPGNQVLVRTKERVPVDGRVVEGTAVICAHLVRGNSAPVTVTTGHRVFAGSTIAQGEIQVTCEQVGSATYIGRVLQILEHASCKSPLLHKQILQLTHNLSLASLALATGVFLVTGDAHRAIAILIVAAPGAAGLASSMALGTASGQAACHGVLVKDDRHMEAVGKADTILFNENSQLSSPSGPDILKLLRQANIPHIGLFKGKTPRQKAQIIHRLQCQGRQVAVLGDASEDALALATANVGIASTDGDNLNLQEAKILMVGPDFRRLPWLSKLARESVKIARQNTVLSIGTNLAGISLGLLDYLTPLNMTILQNVSTFGILFNSSRLLLPVTATAPTGNPYANNTKAMSNG